MWLRRQQRKPLTEEQLWAQTLAEVAEQQQRKARFLRRFYRRALPEWLDRRILFGLLAILLVIIFDGVRRENQEFVAKLTELTGGPVYVRDREDSEPRAVYGHASFTDGNILSTGSNTYATLTFPDGSVVTLAPNTTFEVRVLEYSRGGRWRARSFRLLGGQVWAKVSKYFGPGSDLRVYTPAAVAAVRGTQFSVAYDPDRQQAAVVCNDGLVALAGWRGGVKAVAPGYRASCAYGFEPAPPQTAEKEEFTGFGLAALQRPDVPEHWLKRAELWVTYVLDLPLSVLGIGRCSWGVGAADYARRAAAMEALRLIHIHLEGFTEYPPFVDPVTLRELGLPAKYAQRIASALYGGAIERYYALPHGFVLYGRARDKRRTLYKLTPYGVEKATPEDEAWAGLSM
jgi:hypothetical protein